MRKGTIAEPIETAGATIMSILPRFVCAVASSSLLLGGTPAAAYFNHYLHGTILGTLSRDQADAFARTFKTTLSDTPDDEVVPFQFPADRRHGAIDGTLKVLHTKVDRGERCRQVRSEVNRGKQQEHWVGWWCKQANGDWKQRTIAD